MTTVIFGGNADLCHRAELEARYEYLVEKAKAMEPTRENVQAWLDAHKQEFNTLAICVKLCEHRTL